MNSHASHVEQTDEAVGELIKQLNDLRALAHRENLQLHRRAEKQTERAKRWKRWFWLLAGAVPTLMLVTAYVGSQLWCAA